MPNFEKPKRAGILAAAALLGVIIGGEKAIAETEKTPTDPSGKSKIVENNEQKAERQELFSPDLSVSLNTTTIAGLDLDNLKEMILIEIAKFNTPIGESFSAATCPKWKGKTEKFDLTRIERYGNVALETLSRYPDFESMPDIEKIHAILYLQEVYKVIEHVDSVSKDVHSTKNEEIKSSDSSPRIKEVMRQLTDDSAEKLRSLKKNFQKKGFNLEKDENKCSIEASALAGLMLEDIMQVRKDASEQSPWIFDPQTTAEQYKKAIADILEKNKGYVDEMPDQDRILFAMIIDAALKSNPNAQEADFLPQPKTTDEQIVKAVDKVTQDKKAQTEQAQKPQEEQAPKQMSDDELSALGDKILLDDSAFREAFPNLGLSNRALKQYQKTTELLEQARQQNNAETINELTKNQQEMLQMFQQRGRELLLAIQKELIKNFDVAIEEVTDRDALDAFMNSEKFRKMSKTCQDAFFLLLYNYEEIKNLTDSTPEKQD